MRRLIGSLKDYAWGSTDALPRLLGLTPDGRPWAELWFGTHPGGPAELVDGQPLERVAGALPYLAKFLAAAEPLSLQVHPSPEQAEAGFAAEEAAGIAIDAPHRVYRDASAKPEVMIAITPFRGLCGFRPVAELVPELRACGAGLVADHVEADGYGSTLAWLLSERPPLRPDHSRFHLLDRAYPSDPGALVALLLNEVTLQPGEGVFLAAGQLHMYLEGLGVEVMGASDNVVRGGLTPKHVDLPELARVVDPTPASPEVLRPDPEGWYRLDTPAFAVQRLIAATDWVAEEAELVLFVEPDGTFDAGTAAYIGAGERARFGGGLAYRVTNGRAC